MSFNLQHVFASKRALRRSLAARPIAEKLRLLDAMRERALVIRGATLREAGTVQEESARYGGRKGKKH